MNEDLSLPLTGGDCRVEKILATINDKDGFGETKMKEEDSFCVEMRRRRAEYLNSAKRRKPNSR